MIYSKDCKILTTNLIGSPAHHVLKVTKGLVYQVEIEFPPGCAGQIHIAIFDGGHQCWPSNPDQTFHTDGFTISFQDSYLKYVEPFQFDIFGYAVDTTYDHTPVVRLGLVSKEIYMARFLPTYTYKYFLEVIQQMQTTQDAERQALLADPFPEWEQKEDGGPT